MGCDLGDRVIARKESGESFGFSQSFRNTLTPLAGTEKTLQLGDTRGTNLTRLGRSISGTNLFDPRGSASDTRRNSLSQSSSVPTIGLRRMEALPAAARLGKTTSMTSTRSQDRVPASPSNADDKKEREKRKKTSMLNRKIPSHYHFSKYFVIPCHFFELYEKYYCNNL